MRKSLNVSKSGEVKKNPAWYRIFHWAILIYVFVATIGLCYGGFLFVDFLVTTIKSWV